MRISSPFPLEGKGMGIDKGFKNMKTRLARTLGVCLLVVLLGSVVALPVAAADLRTGPDVTVAKGETIEGDLYVAGSTIVIEGTVNGDVFAAGQSIIISGTVKGGVTAAAQVLTLTGTVGNGARLAGQTITVGGSIGRDLLIAGSEITSTAVVGGDALLVGSVLKLDGRVGRDAKLTGSDIHLGAQVARDVEATAPAVALTGTAAIQGNFTYTSDNHVVTDPGAKVVGTTVRNLPESSKASYVSKLAGQVGGKAVGFLMLFLIGLAFVLLAPRKMDQLGDVMKRQPGRSAAWGALALVVTPFAAVVLMVTVIGLAAGLIGLALWGMAIYLAQIPVGLLIGRLVLRRSGVQRPKRAMLGALALGLAVLAVVSLIPVAGFIIGVAAVLFGMGSAVVMAKGIAG